MHRLDEIGFRLADAKDFSRVRMAQLVLEFWAKLGKNPAGVKKITMMKQSKCS